MKKATLIVFMILLADQALKIWVKTTMALGDEIHVFGDWFILHFVENKGMAFGIQWGDEIGKIMLSLFRIVAIILISYFLYKVTRKKHHPGFVVCIALILAGAMGNLIDSAFYGLIFNESMFQVAEIFPEGGGYAPFLQGHVVDMFYFPLIEGTWPEWAPWVGGDDFIFFRPVFNIADASITIGVIALIIWQKRLFPSKNQ